MRTREEQRAYQREWVAQRKADYFKGKSCVDCGDIFDLELDHIDPSIKIDHKIWSWSKKRRDAELKKCQVLCYACHKAKTIKQFKAPCGTKSSYKRGCRCASCREANTLAMRMYRAGK